MIEVRLETQEWNQLLQILSQAPWNVANPLIMKIGDQLRAQASQTAGLADQIRAQAGQPSGPAGPDRSNSDGREKVEH
ncbi:MAG TPA: hypothetical protein VHT52_13940 [Stellaceae bacterium]|jgi:hypothetical protein|nr:hypothetical protein [Stellaceae bacterium]